MAFPGKTYAVCCWRRQSVRPSVNVTRLTDDASRVLSAPCFWRESLEEGLLGESTDRGRNRVRTQGRVRVQLHNSTTLLSYAEKKTWWRCSRWPALARILNYYWTLINKLFSRQRFFLKNDWLSIGLNLCLLNYSPNVFRAKLPNEQILYTIQITMNTRYKEQANIAWFTFTQDMGWYQSTWFMHI